MTAGTPTDDAPRSRSPSAPDPAPRVLLRFDGDGVERRARVAQGLAGQGYVVAGSAAESATDMVIPDLVITGAHPDLGARLAAMRDSRMTASIPVLVIATAADEDAVAALIESLL